MQRFYIPPCSDFPGQAVHRDTSWYGDNAPQSIPSQLAPVPRPSASHPVTAWRQHPVLQKRVLTWRFYLFIFSWVNVHYANMGIAGLQFCLILQCALNPRSGKVVCAISKIVQHAHLSILPPPKNSLPLYCPPSPSLHAQLAVTPCSVPRVGEQKGARALLPIPMRAPCTRGEILAAGETNACSPEPAGFCSGWDFYAHE